MDRPARRIWVHIGLPKCGSSSIQHHFAENAAAYRGQGLIYPETGRSPDGYRSHLPLVRAARDPVDLERMMVALQREIGAAQQALVSCEELAGALPEGGAGALVAALSRVYGAEAVQIVAYFRNPWGFIESAYAQFLIGGLFWMDQAAFLTQGTPGIERFITSFERMKGFSLLSPLGFAQAISAAFPNNRVHLRSMEAVDLAAGGLVEDLCGLMGLHGQPIASGPRNRRRANRRVAAFQFAQAISPPHRSAKVRDRMRGFRFSHPRPKGAPRFRNSSLCLGVEAAAQVRAAISRDRRALEGLFSTPIDGMCEDRWEPLAKEMRLTPAEEAEIRAFLGAQEV